MPMRTLKECGVEIKGGQILTRVQANENAGDSDNVAFRVFAPKAINPDGTISPEEMSEVKVKRDDLDTVMKKVAHPGDIVMKLSTPYDAAAVDMDTDGGLVPSFCALVSSPGGLDHDYLLAFLNSDLCRSQIRRQMAGMTATLCSPGKLLTLKIPVPDMPRQMETGRDFMETQKKLSLMREIEKLEKMKNSIAFKELEEADDFLI